MDATSDTDTMNASTDADESDVSMLPLSTSSESSPHLSIDHLLRVATLLQMPTPPSAVSSSMRQVSIHEVLPSSHPRLMSLLR